MRVTHRVLVLFGGLMLAVLALCWAGVALLGALPGDRASAAEVREHHFGSIALAPARALDWLGRPVPSAVALLLLALLVVRLVGWRHAALVLAAGTVSLPAVTIKAIVGRSRPSEATAAIGYSFPSGHTAWAVAVFGILAVIAIRRRQWPGAAVCGTVAVIMGPSRVLLGVHWLSDVVAGYAVGTAWLLATLMLGLSWAESHERR